MQKRGFLLYNHQVLLDGKDINAADGYFVLAHEQYPLSNTIYNKRGEMSRSGLLLSRQHMNPTLAVSEWCKY